MMRSHWRDRRQNETRTSGQLEYYRKLAAQFRRMADTEHLASLRRHLRRLAAQHDELVDGMVMQPNNQALALPSQSSHQAADRANRFLSSQGTD
jgi:hypothetical protein